MPRGSASIVGEDRERWCDHLFKEALDHALARAVWQARGAIEQLVPHEGGGADLALVLLEVLHHARVRRGLERLGEDVGVEEEAQRHK
jgi:hypothetical protein